MQGGVGGGHCSLSSGVLNPFESPQTLDYPPASPFQEARHKLGKHSAQRTLVLGGRPYADSGESKTRGLYEFGRD